MTPLSLQSKRSLDMFSPLKCSRFLVRLHRNKREAYCCSISEKGKFNLNDFDPEEKLMGKLSCIYMLPPALTLPALIATTGFMLSNKNKERSSGRCGVREEFGAETTSNLFIQTLLKT